MNDRIQKIKHDLQNYQPGVCSERARIWTKYFKIKKNRSKPVSIQMAEALTKVLLEQTIKINDQELIVGNFTSHRIGGAIYPELHGIPVLEDIFKFNKRKVNPLHLRKKDRKELLKIIPFWSTRFLAMKAFPKIQDKLRFLKSQLDPEIYIINETGGIAHLAPNYEKLVKNGLISFIRETKDSQRKFKENSEQWNFLEASIIVCNGVIKFADRYQKLALERAKEETNQKRKLELKEIASVLERVPRYSATNMQEALQSILLLQIAINLESLDNGISPGRMDQYLISYYQEEEKEKVKELLACFCIKTSEIIPVLSEKITQIHGGLMSGQVVTVGGLTPQGEDATNPLSMIFLDLMESLQLRQPNFHARIHKSSPQEYLDKLFQILQRGKVAPALYNDEAIIEVMTKNGYQPEDARNYVAIGCVEPSAPNKSFSSTDAALFNSPMILELTLNMGKTFHSRKQIGIKTPNPLDFRTFNDLLDAFQQQLQYAIKNLLTDLKSIEIANKTWHPTPLTSTLIEGCINQGICSTSGGAIYNFSGIQCVAPTEVGDALYALNHTVFQQKSHSMCEVIQTLKKNFQNNNNLKQVLKSLPKFGNDIKEVDNYTQYVIDSFNNILAKDQNTRGGQYTTGVYSMTSHQFFGKKTHASPSGRLAGEAFASGLSPSQGNDVNGPTALINSMGHLNYNSIGNGINFNLKFDPTHLNDSNGPKILQALIRTYFKKGGLQIQTNIIDSNILKQAKLNPEKFPNLLVRVSGYSSYFQDLSPEVQDEIIQRTAQTAY